MEQYILIGLTHSMADNLVANHALINKEILHISLASGKSRQSYPAF